MIPKFVPNFIADLVSMSLSFPTNSRILNHFWRKFDLVFQFITTNCAAYTDIARTIKPLLPHLCLHREMLKFDEKGRIIRFYISKVLSKTNEVLDILFPMNYTPNLSQGMHNLLEPQTPYHCTIHAIYMEMLKGNSKILGTPFCQQSHWKQSRTPLFPN